MKYCKFALIFQPLALETAHIIIVNTILPTIPTIVLPLQETVNCIGESVAVVWKKVHIAWRRTSLPRG